MTETCQGILLEFSPNLPEVSLGILTVVYPDYFFQKKNLWNFFRNFPENLGKLVSEIHLEIYSKTPPRTVQEMSSGILPEVFREVHLKILLIAPLRNLTHDPLNIFVEDPMKILPDSNNLSKESAISVECFSGNSSIECFRKTPENCVPSVCSSGSA